MFAELLFIDFYAPPARKYRSACYADALAGPVFVPAAVVTPSFGWFQQWPDHIRRSAPLRQSELAAPVFTPPMVVLPSMAWLIPWPDHVRRTVPKRQEELTSPVFAQPAPAYSWFVSWNEPQRSKRAQMPEAGGQNLSSFPNPAIPFFTHNSVRVVFSLTASTIKVVS